jgi:hypothetical protein
MTSDDFEEPDLTDFRISPFQRERDVIAYCGQILDDLGGDDGSEFTTLPQILLRIRKKIASNKAVSLQALAMFFEEGYE